MKEVREYFEKNYGYVNLDGLSDNFIQDYLGRVYLKGLSFERKMDSLYDYIIANDLTDIQE